MSEVQKSNGPSSIEKDVMEGNQTIPSGDAFQEANTELGTANTPLPIAIAPQSISNSSLSEYSLNRTDRTGEEQDLVGFELLNQYIFLKTLGSGATATVLLANDSETEQMYAVKRMMKKILKRGYFALSDGCTDSHCEEEQHLPQVEEGGTETVALMVVPAEVRSNGVAPIAPTGEEVIIVHVPAVTTVPDKKNRGLQEDTISILPKDQPDCIENEIAILKRVRHPNIVRLHEVIDDHEEDLIYLVMDYAERGPIVKMETGEDGLLRCTPITPVSQVREYSVQIANALLYLHKRMILHRDIKPDNILIDRTVGSRSATLASVTSIATSSLATTLMRGR